MTTPRHTTFARCSFQCGTRAAYVHGCRCERCREANTKYVRDRVARRRSLAAELAAAGALATQAPGPDLCRPWRAPDGSLRLRKFKRPCPGVRGAQCASRSSLRKDSLGGVCGRCRVAATFEGLVPADAARAHLRRLSRKGVGKVSVAAVSDVSLSSVLAIRNRGASRIRARTARRILEVDESCRADASSVPAGPTWVLVRELLELGWTRAAIARELGARTPQLQLGRDRVLLRTADAVARLHARVLRARAAQQHCPRCGRSHQDDPAALAWCLEHRGVPVSALERRQHVPRAQHDGAEAIVRANLPRRAAEGMAVA